MMHRDELINVIETYLGKDLLQEAMVRDTRMANGIQIHGGERINKVIVGVSLTQELLEEAVKQKAEMVLAKHPMLISTVNQLLDPSLQTRLRLIFQYHLTVGGYHYILDIHPEIGNVPLVFNKLEIKPVQRFYSGWGYIGRLSTPTTLTILAKRLKTIVNHAIHVVTPNEEKPIQTIGMVSGGGVAGQTELMEMLRLGVDAYITGEISEWTTHLFKEAGIAYLAAGHHATEVFGPQALAEKINILSNGKVQANFINLWNEI